MSKLLCAVIPPAMVAPLEIGEAPPSISVVRSPARRKALDVALFILCSLPCFVQNASVSGSVSDTTGAVIQRVTIALTNLNTNAVYEAATDQDGLYRVSGLVPGVYSATVSKQGFKSVVKPNIEVHVQDAISIAFTLPTGTVSESVTVTSGASPLVTVYVARPGHRRSAGTGDSAEWKKCYESDCAGSGGHSSRRPPGKRDRQPNCGWGLHQRIWLGKLSNRRRNRGTKSHSL